MQLVNVYQTISLRICSLICFFLVIGGPQAEALVLKPRQIEVGNSSCLLVGDNKIKCWGTNYYGQLGQGDTVPRGALPNEMGNNLKYVDLGTTEKIVSFTSGADHTCVLYETNKVKCWGDNYYGQLALGDRNYRGDQTGEMGTNLPYVNFGTTDKIVKIEAGFYHTCVLFETNKVKCWGHNSSSELGSGNTNNLGDEAAETGTGLPYVDLGSSEKILLLAVGGLHNCVLFESQKIKCWGNNAQGQLGLGDTNSRGDTKEEMGLSLPYVDLKKEEKIENIFAGYYNTCVLFVSHKFKCWGYNSNGQLAGKNITYIGTAPNEMNKLGYLEIGGPAKSLTIGQTHICALLETGNVKCWGGNTSGQLGRGDTVDIGNDPVLMGENLQMVPIENGLPVLQIDSSAYHSCAILINKTVKCWGLNNQGMLGLGDVDNRGDNINEMGSNLPYVDFGSM